MIVEKGTILDIFLFYRFMSYRASHFPESDPRLSMRF